MMNSIRLIYAVMFVFATGMAFGVEQTASDAFDANALGSQWHSGGTLIKATDAGTLPSGDGYVLETDGTASTFMEDVTWESGSVSAYIKHTATAVMQGVAACAPSGMDTTKSQPFYAASYMASGNYLRLWVSNGGAFPGIAISNIDYTLPTAPDGLYHKLTLVINRLTATNPLCVIKWDDAVVTQWNENGGYWESTSVVPGGHPGVFSYFASAGTKMQFDSFSTTFEGVPVELSTFAAE